jgi:methanogenic corrinoid protein MtbC1
MAQGHRPGRLVQLTLAQLGSLSGPSGERGSKPVSIDDPVVLALRRHDTREVVQLLEDSVRELGLAGFICDRMAQLNVDVGIAWARGEVEVFEEHLYTEAVQHVVRSHLARVPGPTRESPRVLLATFPDEAHGLGLVMAQVLLQLEGCPCMSLGVRVPLQQIVAASKAFGADVVGLSFTASMNPAHVLRGLEQLRGELAPQVGVWAGGRSPVLARHRIAGVQPMPQIGELPRAVASWRNARTSAA